MNGLIINSEEIKGDVFIIPNSVRKASEMQFNNMKYILEANDVETDDIMVQVWLCSNDLQSENIGDHGFEYKGRRYHAECSFLPYSLLKDKKEGDEIEVIFPIEVFEKWRETYKTSLFLKIKLRLCQTQYRYSRFGTFEEVLNHLLERYHIIEKRKERR